MLTTTKDLLLTEAQAKRTAGYLETLFSPEADLPQAILVSLSEASLARLHKGAVDPSAMADRLTRLAATIMAAPDPDALGLDPLILAKLAVALSRTEVGTLPMDGIFVRLCEELTRQNRAVLETGRVRLLSALLSSVGFNITVADPPAGMADTPISALQLLQADDDGLLVLSDHLAAGGVQVEADAHEVFGAILLTVLRDYRLDVASRMLRAMLIRDIAFDAAIDGLHFIAVQRSCDGMYGYSDPFSDRFADTSARDREFRVPVTVNALWLFASFALLQE